MIRKLLLYCGKSAPSIFHAFLCLAFVSMTWASNAIASPLTLTSPAIGATLPGASVELAWETEGIAPVQWWVRAGVSAEDRSVYDSGRITNGNTRRHTMTGLPEDSSQIHVQLAYKKPSGGWDVYRYVFNAATPATEDDPTVPDGEEQNPPEEQNPSVPASGLVLVSPETGSNVTGSSIDLRWEANGINVRQWIVRVGSTAESQDIYDSGRIFDVNTRAHTLTGLPTDGSTLYVALSYKNTSGSWVTERYTYTASTIEVPEVPPTDPSDPPVPTDEENNPFTPVNGLALVSPENASTVTGSSFELQWEANGINATQWIVRAGSTPEGQDIYDSGRLYNINTRAHTLTGLPTDGSTLYVALSYKKNTGSWVTERYTFIADTQDTPTTPTTPSTPENPPIDQPVYSGDTQHWTNTETPPPMDAATFTVVRQLSQLGESFWSPAGQSNFHCRGNVYRISGSGKDHDLFIDATGWGTVTQPIIIQNFRNVIVLGLEIEATTIPGCGAGEKLMFWRDLGASWPNDHPHLPSDRLLGLDIYGVAWIEGSHSRMKGHAADHIVTNGGATQTLEQVNTQRWTKIINSRHTGAEGNSAGLHGDWSENHDSGDQHAQAGFVAENSTSKSAYNHATTGYRGDSRWGVIKLHNTMLVNDPNYHTDQIGVNREWRLRPDEINGICVVGEPRRWDIKRLMCQPAGETLRVTIRHSSDPIRYIYAPVFHDGTPTNRSTQGAGLVDRSELIEIKGGWENDSYLEQSIQVWIDENDPAPAEKVGNYYVSPWQELYSTY